MVCYAEGLQRRAFQKLESQRLHTQRAQKTLRKQSVKQLLQTMASWQKPVPKTIHMLATMKFPQMQKNPHVYPDLTPGGGAALPDSPSPFAHVVRFAEAPSVKLNRTTYITCARPPCTLASVPQHGWHRTATYRYSLARALYQR